jgi:hypothetical protein
MLFFAPCAAAQDQPLVSKGDYVLQGMALVQYQGKTEMDLVIPPDLGITGIRDELFEGSCIRSVVIPKGVRKLGARSFMDCYNMISVSIPRSLTTVNISASVTTIGDDTFYGCYGLTSISLLASTPPALGGRAAGFLCAFRRYLCSRRFRGRLQKRGGLERLVARYGPRRKIRNENGSHPEIPKEPGLPRLRVGGAAFLRPL